MIFGAKYIQRIARHLGISTLVALRSRRSRILMYHGIGGPEISAELFEWQVKFLLCHFEIVPLRIFVNRFRSGQLTGNEVSLTFDDGFLSQFTSAARVLIQHSVPATIFVCPGLIETRKWIWNIELRRRLMCLDQGAVGDLVAKLELEGNSRESIVSRAKLLPMKLRHQLEEQVRCLTPSYTPSKDECLQFDLADWKTIRSMPQHLIEVGCHSVHHPILTTLDVDELEQEVSAGRELLTARLDREVDFFCYPNGDFNGSVRNCVQRSFVAAVTTVASFADSSPNQYELGRIPAGESKELFIWRLFRPNS